MQSSNWWCHQWLVWYHDEYRKMIKRLIMVQVTLTDLKRSTLTLHILFKKTKNKQTLYDGKGQKLGFQKPKGDVIVAMLMFYIQFVIVSKIIQINQHNRHYSSLWRWGLAKGQLKRTEGLYSRQEFGMCLIVVWILWYEWCHLTLRDLLTLTSSCLACWKLADVLWLLKMWNFSEHLGKWLPMRWLHISNSALPP